jgi:hypothetical protein
MWLNVAAVLSLVGVVVFFTLLSSTTWFGDE